MPDGRRTSSLLVFFLVVSFSNPSFAQPPLEIRITADEFLFTPAQIQVHQGKYKITVTNEGGFLHGLAIVGRTERIKYIEPNDTTSLIVKFVQAGSYTFFCLQPGHRGKGMEGILKIEKK